MANERTAPSRIRLTGLQEAQLPALVQIEQLCTEMYVEAGFDAAEVPPRSTAGIVRLTKHHNIYVAEADSVVAGYLAWRDESPGVAYIEELSVHPEYHRVGVATRLVEALREEARSLKLEHVTVRCWEKAEWAMSFYKSLGFSPIDVSAPARVKLWREHRSDVRPLTRPGEAALWAEVGAPEPDLDDARAS